MGFGFTGLGTAAGAGRGTSLLIAQRLADRIQAERERAQRTEEAMRSQELTQTGELRRAQIDATAGAADALKQVRLEDIRRAKQADEYAAALEADPSLDARTRTFLKLRRAVPDGAVPATLFDDGTSGSAGSDYKQGFARWLKDHGKTLETATGTDEASFKREWEKLNDRPPPPMNFRFFYGPDGALNAVNPRDPKQPAVPVPGPGGQGTLLTQPPTAEHRNTALAMQGVAPFIKGIVDLSTELNKGSSGVSGRIGGLVQRGAGAVGLNDRADLYERQKKAFAAQLARIGGESGGRFTDQDIERAMGMVPALGDSEALTAENNARLNAFMQQRFAALGLDENGRPIINRSGVRQSGGGAGDAGLLERLNRRRQQRPAAGQ
jgi:hypothetical protein